MADKATKKAIIYLILAAVGLVLCILYAEALAGCPDDLILHYTGLTALCALQAISGVMLAILTKRRREQTKLGRAVTVVFAVSSIPTAVIAVLWALLISIKA
ncbi:MAG: hypothetical protein J6I45_10955 [Clostridia bacterium]|nr:hypothetical protein [Clostridia bacterium]